MTVRCLTKEQKDELARMYKAKEKTQLELAKYYWVSERTVNRVLEEYFLAAPVPRLQGEAYHVMQVLKKHGIDPRDLDHLLEVLLDRSVEEECI